MNVTYIRRIESPAGEIIIASDDGVSLCGLWLKNQKYFATTIKGEMVEKPELEIFLKTSDWLNRYFLGENPSLSELKINPQGSEFRKEVWKILCEIPYGRTITYGEIAKKIAKKYGKKTMSAQAVGGAVGHNPISIIIPCHRVIGADGSLTGYAGGLDIKAKLLKIEKDNSN